MRARIGLSVIAILTVCLANARGELQNVEIGGEITIEGDYYVNILDSRSWLRVPGVFLPGRPIAFGPSIFSWASFDDTNDWHQITQRTRLHVSADFTNNVNAFVEFDSIDTWGEDFRSDYITAADGVTGTFDDVEVYQAYIEANEMFEMPLRLRVGRQELVFGSEWLLGDNSCGPVPFSWGLSYDALRLTYAVERYSVDAFWAKLQENGPVEQDGDVDLYGVYGSYLGIDNWTIDAYWLWVRDGRSLNDTNLTWFAEWMEGLFDVDDYDVTNLHTVGLRGAGTFGAFDIEAEVAYQFGDAGQVGFSFNPAIHGDDDASFDSWACNVAVGYTFGMKWQPRVYAGYAFFEGEDNSDLGFWDWLNPFDRPKASVSFNRLFSDYCYSLLLDAADLTNCHILQFGVGATPTDKVSLDANLRYYLVDEVFDMPVMFRVGDWLIPVAPNFSFWTTSNDDELGWELSLSASYAYSDDLEFGVGWSHFFTGDGAEQGSFVGGNGLWFIGGTDDKEADYLYWYTTISF